MKIPILVIRRTDFLKLVTIEAKVEIFRLAKQLIRASLEFSLTIFNYV